MSSLTAFILGIFLGGTVGVVTMCIFTVSGEESRRERELHIGDDL